MTLVINNQKGWYAIKQRNQTFNFCLSSKITKKKKNCRGLSFLSFLVSFFFLSFFFLSFSSQHAVTNADLTPGLLSFHFFINAASYKSQDSFFFFFCFSFTLIFFFKDYKKISLKSHLFFLSFFLSFFLFKTICL